MWRISNLVRAEHGTHRSPFPMSTAQLAKRNTLRPMRGWCHRSVENPWICTKPQTNMITLNRMVFKRNLLLRVSILSIFRCHACFRGGGWCSIGWFLKPFSKRNPWVGAIEAIPGVDACLPWILGLVMALVRTWTCSKSNSILLLYVVPWFHDQTSHLI